MISLELLILWAISIIAAGAVGMTIGLCVNLTTGKGTNSRGPK